VGGSVGEAEGTSELVGTEEGAAEGVLSKKGLTSPKTFNRRRASSNGEGQGNM
jgi:hypothetical protein